MNPSLCVLTLQPRLDLGRPDRRGTAGGAERVPTCQSHRGCSNLGLVTAPRLPGR